MNFWVRVDNMTASVRKLQTVVFISTGHASHRSEGHSVLGGIVANLLVLLNAYVIRNVV